MSMPALFDARTPQDLSSLVHGFPFAQIVCRDGEGLRASPLPVLPELAPDGTITGLRGHFARANPQVEALRRDPRALAIFTGPHAYISPSWLTDRGQVATWNYAMAQFEVRIRLIDDAEIIAADLTDLIAAMEADRPSPWSMEEIGPRRHALFRRIIGFHAEVLISRARFKLGQDERRDVFADMVAGLRAQGGGALADLMMAFAAG